MQLESFVVSYWLVKTLSFALLKSEIPIELALVPYIFAYLFLIPTALIHALSLTCVCNVVEQ
jgi:hypothetical protein